MSSLKFSLIVAPHDDDIGVEFVDRPARLGEMSAVRLAPARRGGSAPIIAELFAKRRGPGGRVLHRLGHRRIVERGAHHKGPVFIWAQHQRAMRAADPEDLAHPLPPVPPKSWPGLTLNLPIIVSRNLAAFGLVAAL